MDKVPLPYLFSFSKYQTKVLISSVGNVINFKIYLRSTFKAMADREKRSKTVIQKFEYLENEKSFFDKIKNIFIVFEGLSFGGK